MAPTGISTVVAFALVASSSAYVCNLSKDTPIPSGKVPAAGLSPGQLLAAVAQYSSGPALKGTKYTYTSSNNGQSMVFDTDCSCYLDYLSNEYLPKAYALVPPDNTITPPVPRADSWTDYFLNIPASDRKSWEQVLDITSVIPGDVIAYKLPPGSTDTGHVMIAVNSSAVPASITTSPNPYPNDYKAAYWAYVVDASSVKHQNDTRCANCQFQNGVGSGFVRLFVDKTNTVAAFQFSATAGLHTAQFAIGRPLSF